MHRSNIVLNYDLPWNPTKVIQRLGRVNRIGTEFKHIYIYNFFPTDKSDTEIQQKKNITAKIQAFHECLGSDAKFLTEKEEVRTHKLFGDTLYDNLNKKEFYEEEDDYEVSELKYLKIIRDIRDKNKDLYEEIKNIPKKARSSRKHSLPNNLVSFFRKGKLKKFLLASNKGTEERTFLDAITLMECKENETKLKLPKEYFDLLSKNKDYFDQILTKSEEEKTSRRGKSNERQLIDLLKSFRKEPTFKACLGTYFFFITFMPIRTFFTEDQSRSSILLGDIATTLSSTNEPIAINFQWSCTKSTNTSILNSCFY